MLISRVVGDCPECKGKGTFGNVSVQDNLVSRACETCGHESVVWLPDIHKKVLYLDQFVFSHAFGGIDKRFLTALERVKKLCHLQLLVAPYSSVHEDETHQWQKHHELMDFIKLTARGVKFECGYRIESAQILKAFTAYLNNESPEYKFENSDAIQGDLNAWDNYFFIDVDGYWHDVETKRRLKEESADQLVTTFDSWQQSAQTFDEDIALEYRDASCIYLKHYIDKVDRIRQGDVGAIHNSPLVANVVERMRNRLPKDMSELEQLQICADFFKSAHFVEVPHQWISARIFATLKAMVRRGDYSNRLKARKRLRGIFEDIMHISLYAPYCDAFVMDKAMAELVRQSSIGLESRYGVQIFSVNNWEEFLAWLDTLEAGMSSEHRAGVDAAYPSCT